LRAVTASAVADGSDQITQDEIESLLRQAQGLDAAKPSRTETAKGVATAARPASAAPPADDIELLLRQAEEALASVDSPSSAAAPGAAPFHWQDFGGTPPSTEKATLELLRDVELELKIELGRTQMYLEEVLALRKGSVVPLDKLAGDPVDVYVNGRLIARGEVLVLNDNFCVRVAELIAGEETS
jgi:flagellar motor switch protein FliN